MSEASAVNSQLDNLAAPLLKDEFVDDSDAVSAPTTEVFDGDFHAHGQGVQQKTYRTYASRWWCCAVLSVVAGLQGLVWNTFSPLAPAMKELEGWSDGTIAMLSNWGPIAYVIAVFPNSYLMDAKGLRPAVLVAASLVFFGCLVRCFTVARSPMTGLAHFGQFLNGLAGPVAMSAAPVLSATWFPPHERHTATAIVEAVNAFGVALSFVLGPAIVPSEVDDDDVPLSSKARAVLTSNTLSYMRGQTVVAAVSLAAVLVYFPSRPSTPPAPSSVATRAGFRAGLRALCSHRQFWIIAVSYALCTGVYGGWSGFIAPNLEPILGQAVAESESGWLGFYSTLAGVLTMPVLGWCADRLGWKLRTMLAVLTSSGAVFFLFFAVLCLNTSSMPLRTGPLYFTCILGGVVVYGSIPLFFEGAAECAYPVAEGLATGVLTLLNNVAGLIFLLLPLIPGLGTAYCNWAVVGAMVISAALLSLFKEQHSRAAHDTGFSISQTVQHSTANEPVLSVQ